MVPLILFIAALISIVVLFVVRHVEVQRGELLFATKARRACDARIVYLEDRCKHVCTLERMLRFVRHAYNTLAHKFAKVTASIAKRIEWRARSVAHKSAKARQGGEDLRENEYLKDVQNHKDSLNTTKVAEESKL